MSTPDILGVAAESETPGTATSLEVTLPTGIVAGERLLVVGYSTTSGQTLSTATSGWERLADGATNTNGYLGVFGKIAVGGGADAAPILTTSLGNADPIVAIAFRVQSSAALADLLKDIAWGTASGGSNYSTPGLTPSIDDGLLLIGVGANGTSNYTGTQHPASVTMVAEEAGSGCWLGVAKQALGVGSIGVPIAAKTWTNAVNAKRTFSLVINGGSAAAAPVISSGTPTGTLATTTTATIGATTNQNTGTLYTVLSTSSSDLDTITGTQIKAGQIDSGSAAPFSGNDIVSTTTPTISISGLSDNTTYYYATIQNNTNGDSNILTGSFTTALATRSVNVSIVDGAGSPLASTAVKWWVREDLGDAASSPNAGTSSTNGSGVLGLTGLTVPAGAAVVTVELDSDSDFSSNYYVTLT